MPAPQIPPALPPLVEVLKSVDAIERVVLFGSRARGEAGPRSDIDLAVAAPSATAREWAAVCDMVDEAETLLKLDLTRLDRAPQELQDVIRREGVLLYARHTGSQQPH